MKIAQPFKVGLKASFGTSPEEGLAEVVFAQLRETAPGRHP
jgi:hypothetical protein